MTTKVALLGTGLMGAGMARSMARTGLAVTVWNRTPAKARPLADAGAVVAEDAQSAVRDADVVVTMLFDAPAVEEVMARALPAMARHAIWAQCATIGLDATERLARQAERHGTAFVDSPVLGTRRPAEEGNLTVLAAGPSAVRERLAPVFDAVASRVMWVGERPGDGHRVKLTANAWVLSVTAATGQSVGLARALGIDPRLFLELIAGGSLDCGYAQVKGAAMIKGEFAPPSFTLDGAAKDAGLIAEAMAEAGCDDRVMRALRGAFQAGAEGGHDEDDMAGVVRAFTGAAGL